jgi:hypothetical protein
VLAQQSPFFDDLLRKKALSIRLAGFSPSPSQGFGKLLHWGVAAYDNLIEPKARFPEDVAYRLLL